MMLTWIHNYVFDRVIKLWSWRIYSSKLCGESENFLEKLSIQPVLEIDTSWYSRCLQKIRTIHIIFVLPSSYTETCQISFINVRSINSAIIYLLHHSSWCVWGFSIKSWQSWSIYDFWSQTFLSWDIKCVII